MTFFRAVRIYSALEATLFTALLVVWIGGFGREPQFVLGLTHGIGWIALCVLVWAGCMRRIFPWPLLAATVSPFGPIGCTLGFELLLHQRRRRGGHAAPLARRRIATERPD